MTDEKAFADVLNHYRHRIKEEREWLESLPPEQRMGHRDRILLEVGEEAANLLVDLIVGAGAKTIVELGTSFGYSTLFLAKAAKRTGGKVYTYELAAEKQAYAKERLAEAGVEPSVGSVGNSYDNALAETVIGLYKTEVIRRRGRVYVVCDNPRHKQRQG